MKPMMQLVAVMAVLVGGTIAARAADVDPAVQTKIDAHLKTIQAWAADPAIVSAVKEANANPSAEAKAMTQDKWKSLNIMDGFVRSFSKNAAGQFLKSKKDDIVSEAFLSAADGTKVAFISKPSFWCHAGKAKHDNPMKGQTWQGAIEVDESTGMQQVQLAVPVKDGDKVIGSLVVGLSVSKMKE